MASPDYAIQRLANGPASVLAATIADLPPAPYNGLRLGDRALILGGFSEYVLYPPVSATTVALVEAAARATWIWALVA